MQQIQLTHGRETLHGVSTNLENAHGTVVYVHGTGGNYHEHSFIDASADLYTNSGRNFLAVNVPGHDATAFDESFDDSIAALDGWITQDAPTGPLVLQGHSSGALKMLRYIQRGIHAHRVERIVLLAPFDVVVFYGGPTEEGRRARAAELDALIATSGSQTPVPPELFDAWPVSAGTMREAITEEGPWDQFPVRKRLLGSVVEDIEVPVLVAIGSQDLDELIPQESAEFFDPIAICKMAEELPNVTTALIDGAAHSFTNCEDILIKSIQEWLIN